MATPLGRPRSLPSERSLGLFAPTTQRSNHFSGPFPWVFLTSCSALNTTTEGRAIASPFPGMSGGTRPFGNLSPTLRAQIPESLRTSISHDVNSSSSDETILWPIESLLAGSHIATPNRLMTLADRLTADGNLPIRVDHWVLEWQVPSGPPPHFIHCHSWPCG